jgi:hypothetical protein
MLQGEYAILGGKGMNATCNEQQSAVATAGKEIDGERLSGQIFHYGGGPEPDEYNMHIEWTPEQALMLAILEDAIACYRRELRRPRQNPEILARQAEFWIKTNDWNSPFSFNNVCEGLGLGSVATRQRILARDKADSYVGLDS